MISFEPCSSLATPNIIYIKLYVSCLIPRIFSPLGLLLPYISQAKRLLSRIRFYKEGKKALGWNNTLPLHLQKELDEWLKGLHSIPQVTFLGSSSIT